MRTFTCNICDNVNVVPVRQLDREIVSCSGCGSTVRLRSVIYLLAQALFRAPKTLGELSVDKSIRGIGLSDWTGYAAPLERLFDYTNTYYHQEPRLDIVSPPADIIGTCDFVISSDVFEHVMPPVSRAFEGAFSLLKPGGHFVLTVPFTIHNRTTEHYPNAREYAVVKFVDRTCVVTRDTDGRITLDASPVFHGGDGETLEMRVFGFRDLKTQLKAAGFSDVTVFEKPVPEYGIAFPWPWSLPILARKQA